LRGAYQELRHAPATARSQDNGRPVTDVGGLATRPWATVAVAQGLCLCQARFPRDALLQQEGARRRNEQGGLLGLLETNPGFGRTVRDWRERRVAQGYPEAGDTVFFGERGRGGAA
jgi:hypothetical protein